MAYREFGGGRKIPQKREYFIDYGDGFDDVLDRCKKLHGCYKCKTKPIPILQHQRSANEHWIYLCCPKHPKNRTYMNLDYIAMFRAWQFLQKIGREELKNARQVQENG